MAMLVSVWDWVKGLAHYTDNTNRPQTLCQQKYVSQTFYVISIIIVKHTAAINIIISLMVSSTEWKCWLSTVGKLTGMTQWEND